MRTIHGIVLGTYYAVGAEAARDTPNASSMRGLVYAIKDNRPVPNRPQPIQHPLHPSKVPVMVDRTNAIEYVTAMLSRYIPQLAKRFGANDQRAVTLVPVPSSEVTPTTIETARFPTLRLCRALAGVGLGTVAVLATQRKKVTAKTTGARRTPDQILADFIRTDMAIPRGTAIVLVDDNVQRGASIAALDRLLGITRPTSAFAVAITDSQSCADAMKTRRFSIEYDDTAHALDVTCTVEPVAP